MKSKKKSKSKNANAHWVVILNSTLNAQVDYKQFNSIEIAIEFIREETRLGRGHSFILAKEIPLLITKKIIVDVNTEFEELHSSEVCDDCVPHNE